MLKDKTTNSIYKNNTLRQDKLLWIAREYQKQGIKYVEMTDTDLAKNGEPAIKMLEEIHSIMPLIEKETGVNIQKIDVDEDEEHVIAYGVRNIPTLIFLKNGKVVDKISGTVSKDILMNKVNEYK